MASRGPIFDRLRIKYGLPDNPSPDMVRRWVERTNEYIRIGRSREEAGRQSASSIFPGFETRVYASESETIDTLLTEALRK